MIELINVTKKYNEKKNKKETIALNKINYKFEDTGLYFVTGKSGSGKSTLLSILSGIDFSFDGNLIIDNKSIKDFTKNDINYYRSTYVGYVFQEYNLIPELNAYENVKLGFDVSSNDNLEEIDNIFKKLDIEELKTRDINELSGGEKQRIAIARSLVKKPKVILTDEPTGALDPINSKNIMDLFEMLSKEYLVIIVTHNINYLDEYESKKIYLDHGNMTSSDITDKKDCNTYVAQKYHGLSYTHKLKIGFETLFHKKVTLFFSLFFIIISLLLISISISGALYNENYTVYKAMESFDDYLVLRYFYWNDINDPRYVNINSIEYANKNCSDIVNAYSINTLVENYDISMLVDDYFSKDNNDDFSSDSPIVFEYDEKSINLFELKVICGTDDIALDEIIITDIIANYFIEYDYNNGVAKEIKSFEDLIGLTLFDKKIAGIVTTKKSNEYLDLYNRKDEVSNEVIRRIFQATYSGIANAIFTKKDLYSSMPVYISLDKSDYIRYDNQELIKERNSEIKNVEYFEGYDENSHGIIYNINYISMFFSDCSFEEGVEDYYKRYRSRPQFDSLSDEEVHEMAYNNYKDYIVRRIKSSRTISFSPDNYGDYNGLDFQKIVNSVGVSYDLDDNTLFYVDAENIEEYNKYKEYTTVVAMYGSLKNTNADFFNFVFDNYKIAKSEETYDYYLLLSNEYAEMIHREKNVFNVLQIVFTSLGFAFLSISIFILYKCINDAISYKERTIGVLKSIGVSGRDIFEIFSIQSVFIIMISLILSLSLQYAGIYTVNVIMSKLYDINQYIYSFRILFINWLVVIGIAIIIPLIATLHPIIKLSLKNPKDIINKE